MEGGRERRKESEREKTKGVMKRKVFKLRQRQTNTSNMYMYIYNRYIYVERGVVWIRVQCTCTYMCMHKEKYRTLHQQTPYHKTENFLCWKFSRFKILADLWFNTLLKYVMIFDFAVGGNCNNWITVQFTYLCIKHNLWRTTRWRLMKSHSVYTCNRRSQSTCTILKDLRRGRVQRVKKLMWRLNLVNFNIAVRPQMRKFLDRENFPSYGIWLCM